MIIDIDIKITDDSGKVIHRFGKQFDERTGTERNYTVRNGIKKEFQDFLYEYLSDSGRTIRERLINTTKTGYTSKLLPYKNASTNEYSLAGNGLKYKINISNGRVFMGRIPIDRVKRIERVKEAIDTEEQGEIPLEAKQQLPGLNGFTVDYETRHRGADTKEQKEKEMKEAVTKYEASFCVEENENGN